MAVKSLISALVCVMLVVSRPWAQGLPCPTDTLRETGPMPLADLLTDYLPGDSVYGKGLLKVAICDKQSWERKRQSVMRRARHLLGVAPEVSGPLGARVLSEVQEEGYIRRKVQFNSGTGDTISGYLLVPGPGQPGTRLPAVLAMHGTIAPGAAVTVGVEKVRENRYFGMELAQRGYVVLAVDMIAAGERIYLGAQAFETDGFYREHPNWSAMGKMLYDHQRALDWLCTLPFVDSSRIGAIGHSLGGYNAFFLQAFDTRIKAAVTSCGFTPLAGTADPYQFARDRWFVHFPLLLRDFLRAGIVPCDMHEVMALCAPRPLFNYSAKKDHIFPCWPAVDQALGQVARLYGVLGAGGAFERVDGEGDHDFPNEVRQRAFVWLDRWLK